MIVGVAGCVAQAEGEEILRRAPSVDLVVGPQTYHRLPERWPRVRTRRDASSTPTSPIEDKFDHLPAAPRQRSSARGVTAFLTVQEGCDKFCTFCVVPYTRGAEVSRPLAQILAEARAPGRCRRARDHAARPERQCLARQRPGRQRDGAWRICCSGSPDSMAWRGSATRPAIPRDMDDELIAAHRDLPQADALSASAGAVGLRPHPQGDEPPPHGRRLSRRSIERIRAARPDMALSGDFIVGFPGRDATRISRRRSIWCATSATPRPISFKYSPRPGTPGAEHGRPGRRSGQGRAAGSACRRCSTSSSATSESRVGRRSTCCIEKPGRIPARSSAARPGCRR